MIRLCKNVSFKVFCANVHLGSKILPFRCLFRCSCRLMCFCACLWLHTACHSTRRQTPTDSVTTADCSGLLSIWSAKIPLRPQRSLAPGPLYFKKVVALFTKRPFQKVSQQNSNGPFCAKELKIRFQPCRYRRSATCAIKTTQGLNVLLEWNHF